MAGKRQGSTEAILAASLQGLLSPTECSGDLGGVWEPARSYPEVQTQSPQDLYPYTDKPMPDSYPEWPNEPQIRAYLTDYAKDHGLMPRMRCNTTVVGMVRRDCGLPGWTLKIQNPDSSTDLDPNEGEVWLNERERASGRAIGDWFGLRDGDQNF